MSEPKRGLGRGLSALLGEAPRGAPPPRDGAGVQLLPVASIRPNPDQPRRHFDDKALQELAESIGERGVIQPIVVRAQGDAWEIVAGERRWRAAQRAQLHEIPALVRTLDDRATFELAIIENVQRADLNPVEEAEAYQRLMAEFGHTQEVLGRIVGKPRSHVANLLRLLELPEPVRGAVGEGRLSFGHAKVIAGAADPVAVAAEVERNELSVRETEALVRKGRAPKAPRRAPIEYKGSAADTLALERQLGDLLGLKVGVTNGPKGGTVTLAYSTLDQLDMICRRLSDEPI